MVDLPSSSSHENNEVKIHPLESRSATDNKVFTNPVEKKEVIAVEKKKVVTEEVAAVAASIDRDEQKLVRKKLAQLLLF